MTRRTRTGLWAALAAGVALLGLTAGTRWDKVPAPPAGADHVVVLHGLGRSSASMKLLARRIAKGSFVAHLVDYPSTAATFDELIAHLGTEVERCCADAPRLHFVTYSLGGILVRGYLADEPPANLGRVVMIAPPNGGSELVDTFGDNPAFGKIFGEVGKSLGTGEQALPRRLGPPRFEFGVVAGTRALHPAGWFLIPGESDGTVAVENTKLPGMADFITLPHSHTFIMNSKRCAHQTRYFLGRGRFDHCAETPNSEPSCPPI